jgi:rubrerythrin
MSYLKEDTKLAIELEKKGYEFYKETAEKTKNPLASSTLSSLAEREQLHIERIYEFFQDLTGEKILKSDWLSKVEVPPTKGELLKPILSKLKGSLDKKFETKEDINEAYQVAEGLERDSFSLYERIARETPDETAKKFYSALALEEREHFDILEDTLLYLNDPGEWYRRTERWIVEG